MRKGLIRRIDEAWGKEEEGEKEGNGGGEGEESSCMHILIFHCPG